MHVKCLISNCLGAEMAIKEKELSLRPANQNWSIVVMFIILVGINIVSIEVELAEKLIC